VTIQDALNDIFCQKDPGSLEVADGPRQVDELTTSGFLEDSDCPFDTDTLRNGPLTAFNLVDQEEASFHFQSKGDGVPFSGAELKGTATRPWVCGPRPRLEALWPSAGRPQAPWDEEARAGLPAE